MGPKADRWFEGYITALTEEGIGYNEIIKRCKEKGTTVSKPTIYRILHAKGKLRSCEANGVKFERKLRTRPLTTKAVVDEVKRLISGENPESQRMIAKRVGVSPATVNRIIAEDLLLKKRRKRTSPCRDSKVVSPKSSQKMKRVKTVSQDIFDNVVSENVRELEMNHADAMKKAIKQFEAQGVDLTNIVKEVMVISDDSGVILTPSERAAKLVVDLLVFADCYLDKPAGSLEVALSSVADECHKGIANRCLVGAQQAATVLFIILRATVSQSDWLMANAVLDTLHALTDGQPDVFVAADLHFLIGVGDERLADAELCGRLVRVVRNACVKHETNRQTVVSGGLVALLMRIAEEQKTSPVVIKAVLQTLRCLILDDYLRVPYGKAHDKAKMIVPDFAGIKALMKIAKDATIDHGVLFELLATLSNLAVRSEYCQEIVDEGGLAFVVKALLENIENQALVSTGLSVMKTIAGNDSVKEEIVKAGGIELILSAMSKHQAEFKVNEATCSCLAALALRSPANCQAIMDAGGCAAIVTAIKVHKTKWSVQRAACRAIRNLVSRTKHFRSEFLYSGVEELINASWKLHPKMEDDAKAALRDLGC